MNYLKNILKKGILGLTLGVFINQVIFIIICLNSNSNVLTININTLLLQFAFSAFLGFYCCSLSVIFEIEKWSLLRQTFTHFICMSIVYFPISIHAKWLPYGSFGKILFIIFYIFIYICIWIIFKIHWSRKIKKLNMALTKHNNSK